jgi:hypothetical protein
MVKEIDDARPDWICLNVTETMFGEQILKVLLIFLLSLSMYWRPSKERQVE